MFRSFRKSVGDSSGSEVKKADRSRRRSVDLSLANKVNKVHEDDDGGLRRQASDEDLSRSTRTVSPSAGTTTTTGASNGSPPLPSPTTTAGSGSDSGFGDDSGLPASIRFASRAEIVSGNLDEVSKRSAQIARVSSVPLIVRVSFPDERTFKTIAITANSTAASTVQALLLKMARGLPSDSFRAIQQKYQHHRLYLQAFSENPNAEPLAPETLLMPLTTRDNDSPASNISVQVFYLQKKSRGSRISLRLRDPPAREKAKTLLFTSINVPPRAPTAAAATTTGGSGSNSNSPSPSSVVASSSNSPRSRAATAGATAASSFLSSVTANQQHQHQQQQQQQQQGSHVMSAAPLPPPLVPGTKPMLPLDLTPVQNMDLLLRRASPASGRLSRMSVANELMRQRSILHLTAAIQAAEEMAAQLPEPAPPAPPATLFPNWDSTAHVERPAAGSSVAAESPVRKPQVTTNGGLEHIPTNMTVSAPADLAISADKSKQAPQLPPPPRNEEKANNAVNELLLTERNFVFDLDLLLEAILKPLRNREVLPTNVLSDIFLNMERIAAFHRELYRRLSAEQSVRCISASFSPDMLAELERIYTVYLGHYEQALALFYRMRDESEKFKKFLSRMGQLVSDKSLNNLLVIPVQRVCKYELLLKNVLSQHFKSIQAAAAETNTLDNKDADVCIALQCQIETLSSIIQRIDRKRAEADRWDKVCRLEQRLTLNEPLRKKGRFIVLEGQLTIQEVDGTSFECSVVLFNDLLVRAATPTKRSDKATADRIARIFALLPVMQLVVVDPESRFSDARSLLLANTDPRYGDGFRMVFATESERTQWYQSFVRYSLSMKQLCCDWGIPWADFTNEQVLCAERCCWKQAYVAECRILITSNHFCICWEAFGSTERETLPLSTITSFRRQGADGLDIAIEGWKGSYQFTSLQTLDNTLTVLEALRKSRAASKAAAATTATTTTSTSATATATSPVPLGVSPDDALDAPACTDLDPLILDEADQLELWRDGDTLSFVHEEVILLPETRNISLYQILTGNVTVQDSDGHQVALLAEGDIFGVRSFLDGRKAGITVTGGGAGVTVIAINRPSILEQLTDNPRLLAKFMAMLGCKAALGAL